MADIYREAMDAVEAPVVATFNPQDICAGLELEESSKNCQKKLEAHARAAYRQIDSNPAQQPLDYVEYTRTVLSELDNLFPRLENPDLVIYVYPHLATRTRAPIPGYTTVVPLYERVEYRLPGESLLNTPAAPNIEAPSAAGAPACAALRCGSSPCPRECGGGPNGIDPQTGVGLRQRYPAPTFRERLPRRRRGRHSDHAARAENPEGRRGLIVREGWPEGPNNPLDQLDLRNAAARVLRLALLRPPRAFDSSGAEAARAFDSSGAGGAVGRVPPRAT